MSVVATNASSTFAGNGATTAFPFTFACRNAANLVVYVNGALQLSGITVVLNADYNGGTVTFSVAPANGAVILVASTPSFEQQIGFENAGPYNPVSVDGMADEAAIRDIYLLALFSRAPLVPIGETLGSLPAKAARVGLVFGFDAAGNPIAVNPGGADSALRTDLAASTGPALLGFSSSGIYGAGTLGQALTRQGTAVADSNLAQGVLVNLYVNAGITHMQLADASAAKPAHAFCPVAVANGANGAWSRRGIIPGTSGNAFAADLWLSDITPGGTVSVAPSTAGHLSQHVGMVLPGLGIEFDPKPEIQL